MDWSKSNSKLHLYSQRYGNTIASAILYQDGLGSAPGENIPSCIISHRGNEYASTTSIKASTNQSFILSSIAGVCSTPESGSGI